jgi:hypothetical protein
LVSLFEKTVMSPEAMIEQNDIRTHSDPISSPGPKMRAASMSTQLAGDAVHANGHPHTCRKLVPVTVLRGRAGEY